MSMLEKFKFQQNDIKIKGKYKIELFQNGKLVQEIKKDNFIVEDENLLSSVSVGSFLTSDVDFHNNGDTGNVLDNAVIFATDINNKVSPQGSIPDGQRVWFGHSYSNAVLNELCGEYNSTISRKDTIGETKEYTIVLDFLKDKGNGTFQNVYLMAKNKYATNTSSTYGVCGGLGNGYPVYSKWNNIMQLNNELSLFNPPVEPTLRLTDNIIPYPLSTFEYVGYAPKLMNQIYYFSFDNSTKEMRYEKITGIPNMENLYISTKDGEIITWDRNSVGTTQDLSFYSLNRETLSATKTGGVSLKLEDVENNSNLTIKNIYYFNNFFYTILHNKDNINTGYIAKFTRTGEYVRHIGVLGRCINSYTYTSIAIIGDEEYLIYNDSNSAYGTVDSTITKISWANEELNDFSATNKRGLTMDKHTSSLYHYAPRQLKPNKNMFVRLRAENTSYSSSGTKTYIELCRINVPLSSIQLESPVTKTNEQTMRITYTININLNFLEKYLT